MQRITMNHGQAGNHPRAGEHADRAALKAAAGSEPVSTWLRRLGLDEAKRRSAARSVAALLDEERSEGFGLSEAEAANLAEQATHAIRRRAR
jgi:hypothetical protein